LGLQTVKVLASKNTRVYLSCRSVEKFNQVITEIEDACSSSVVKSISFLQLDLASAATASAAADEFNA
jgi:short-subunit dehydrogenase